MEPAKAQEHEPDPNGGLYERRLLGSGEDRMNHALHHRKWRFPRSSTNRRKMVPDEPARSCRFSAVFFVGGKCGIIHGNEQERDKEGSLRDGVLKTTGTDIDQILPPLSRFGTARQQTKDRVIAALQVLFDRYKGISKPAS